VVSLSLFSTIWPKVSLLTSIGYTHDIKTRVCLCARWITWQSSDQSELSPNYVIILR